MAEANVGEAYEADADLPGAPTAAELNDQSSVSPGGGDQGEVF